jgi:SAM-dependent methyltransferase
MADRKNVDVFDRDALSHGGYLYTNSDRLSCRLATQRSTDAILAADCFRGRSVIDLGCGDGFYSLRWWDLGHPKALVGIDPASQAIEIANKNKNHRPIEFLVGDAHQLQFPNDSFDVALIQSILHHDDDPLDIIREAFRVAPVILVHEPNGNNPGLKLIEKISRYHREHNEKSYSSRQLVRWINECGGRVTYQKFAGFVPMFSPDWLARMTKAVEPAVESIPLVNLWGCAVSVTVANRQ